MAPPDPASSSEVSPAYGPLPPPDFTTRALPTDVISARSRLVRLHRNDLRPLFFGGTGGNRFDDPRKEFGTCYLATSIEGAFAETCLRSVGARFVALSFLDARSFCDIEVVAPLRVVSLHGSGLAQLGATGAVTSGPHVVAQEWSRAIHDHPAAPDGISYRSNHDNGELCIALFDRASHHLAPGLPQPVLGDKHRLAALLNRYNVGLG